MEQELKEYYEKEFSIGTRAYLPKFENLSEEQKESLKKTVAYSFWLLNKRIKSLIESIRKVFK